jgi:hypothetical protein
VGTTATVLEYPASTPPLAGWSLNSYRVPLTSIPAVQLVPVTGYGSLVNPGSPAVTLRVQT